jgi:hypothetical protein
MRAHVPTRRRGLVLLLWAAAWLWAAGGTHASADGGADALDAAPDPALAPQDVVRLQLEALRRNDAADRGIAAAFRFASPQNRRSTGPLPRFGRMIKQGPYALMLRYSDAAYGPVQVRGRRAVQRVTLYAPGRAPVSYAFFLSRQRQDGPLDGCWMTDAVQALPVAGTQA